MFIANDVSGTLRSRFSARNWTDLEPEVDRTRAGTGPISVRNTTDLGDEGASSAGDSQAAFSSSDDGDVGEAEDIGKVVLVPGVVEGDGVLAGVGPDDAHGGGGAFFEGAGQRLLGEGPVAVYVWWEVVGGVDALAVGQEGQSAGGADGFDPPCFSS